MNVSRRLPNTWVVNNRIYTGGGFGASDGGYLSSIELFDPIANQWVFAGSLPQNKYSSSCVNLNGKIFIMGGRDRFDAVTGNYLNKLHVADYKRGHIGREWPKSWVLLNHEWGSLGNGFECGWAVGGWNHHQPEFARASPKWK